MRPTACAHDDRQCPNGGIARLAELLPMAIWFIGADGSLEFANAAAREMPRRVLQFAASVKAAQVRLIRQGGVEIMVMSGEGGRNRSIGFAGYPLSPVVMQHLYGLSPAEARVAIELAAGRTPREVSASLAISVHTVRNHLKSLFAKTETRSQNGLVARLVAGAAALRLDDRTLTQLGHSPTKGER